MIVKQVVEQLDDIFKPQYQEDYDNAGFLLGAANTPCTGALIAIDLTQQVITEAQELGLNLIVTHHPFIFSGIKRITDATDTGQMIMRLIEAGISVYAAHTNLDNMPWGVSAALAQRIGLVDCQVLRPMAQNAQVGSGLVGRLAVPEQASAFLQRIKQVVGIPVVRISTPIANRTIRRVALCGGSGAFLIGDAEKAGADIYITADLKYHDFQKTSHMMLADIGHYESEQFAKELILHCISEKISNFACQISAQQQGIVAYI